MAWIVVVAAVLAVLPSMPVPAYIMSRLAVAMAIGLALTVAIRMLRMLMGVAIPVVVAGLGLWRQGYQADSGQQGQACHYPVHNVLHLSSLRPTFAEPQAQNTKVCLNRS